MTRRCHCHLFSTDTGWVVLVEIIGHGKFWGEWKHFKLLSRPITVRNEQTHFCLLSVRGMGFLKNYEIIFQSKIIFYFFWKKSHSSEGNFSYHFWLILKCVWTAMLGTNFADTDPTHANEVGAPATFAVYYSHKKPVNWIEHWNISLICFTTLINILHSL